MRGYTAHAYPNQSEKIMLKVLSQNKINSILAECQTPDAVKVLIYTKNGEPCEATAQTVYHVFSGLGGKEQPQYAVLPDGNVMLCLISTRPDCKEQSRRCFIVRFNDTNFLN